MTKRTLAIDIGGTGIKAMLLGGDGAPLGERARVETPRPATPDAVLAAVFTLIAPVGPFDRVSVGFPGVVVDGVTMTAHNLDPAWVGLNLAKAITVTPHRIVRDTLFRLGFVETPYAKDGAALIAAASAARKAVPKGAADEILTMFALAAGCAYDCTHRRTCDFPCRERLE